MATQTVTGTITTGVTLSASYTTFTSTALVTNSNPPAAVYGDTATSFTVTNAGSIGGAGYTGVHTTGSGVYLGGGGGITNQSDGTITGYYGVKLAGSPATLVNSGHIAGNDTSPANSADGVYLSAGGSVTNLSSGTIYGRNDGVLITGDRGTVVNLGSIHSRVDANYGGRGVSLDAGGVIINGAAGGLASTARIAGYNYAIQFGPTGTDTLINYGTASPAPWRCRC